MDGSEPFDGSAQLEGRAAVVTGAGSGFGAAIAHELARAGMAVAALDIDPGRAEETAASVRGLGVAAIAVPFDAGDAASIRDAARHVDERLGSCSLLCANVGVQQFGSLDRLTDDDWTWVIGVNVLGTVRTVTAFLPLLRRASGWRHVAITASVGVFTPAVRLGAYTASKAALVGYGETLRLELAPEGIGVTLVFPSGMMTRHLESSAAARPETLGPSVTLPDDIEAMMAGAPSMHADEVVEAADAVRGLVPQLVADEPYVFTHGRLRAGYEARHREILRAIERMERARGLA
ncbi:MAG TPA: SDR family oxidoreductase [Acidimicrobiia bacterium]|nr:SDR family oxidoreductase [Acidimicrobiia bacterium]